MLTEKRIYNAGFLAYAGLLVLCVLFYKERTIFLDNAFFLFEILRTEEPTIQRHRFISAVPQFLPLLAAKVSLSLKWVLIAFSVGFMLYQLLCYIITGYVLKNYKLGIGLLLAHILIISHVFYWGLSELLLGIGLLFPFWAIFAGKHHRLPVAVLLVLQITGVFLIVFSHPLIIVPFMFTAVYFWLNKNATISKKQLIVWVGVFLLIFAFKSLFLSDSYESKSTDLAKNVFSFFPNYMTYTLKQFVKACLVKYYWVPILLAVISVNYIRNKRWWLLGFIWASVLGHLIIVTSSYPNEYFGAFYVENMYMVLGVMLALPLVYDIMPNINIKLTWALYLLIILSSFYRISTQHEFYANRLSWFRGYLDQYGDQKMMVSYDNKPQATILMEWATPYEFWLLSTLERDKSASIIIHNNVNEIGWAYDNYKAFVGRWGVYPYKELNPLYFKFTDSSTSYGVYREGR